MGDTGIKNKSPGFQPMAHPERESKLHQRHLSWISALSLLLLTPAWPPWSHWAKQATFFSFMSKFRAKTPNRGHQPLPCPLLGSCYGTRERSCVPTRHCFLCCRIGSFPLPVAPSQFRNLSLPVKALTGVRAWLRFGRPEFQRSSEAGHLAYLIGVPL